MESIKFDKSRNKIVRKSCRKLKEQGANVTEVYINLFKNLITINFIYNSKKFKILDNNVGDNITETLKLILKN